MSKELNQTVKESFVTSIYVERLFNLGNYENIKHGVRVELDGGDNPGLVLANVERILGDLRVHSGVDKYDLRRAKAALEKPEAELNEYEQKNLDTYRNCIRKDEEARERRRKARQALATLNYTIEHKDHKEDWEDGGFDVEF